MPRGRPRKLVKAPRHQIGNPLAGMTVEQERVYAETIRVRYHDLGYTQDEIAAEDHRSHYTISELMKRHRIPTRRGYPARAIAAASRLPDPEDALITPALRELGR